jgi:hypothetical protein
MRFHNKDVFINCPFEEGSYSKLFNSIIFTILDCGFIPRCAKEKVDSGEERISKIQNIIEQCQFGIHDISMTTLDSVTNLPRFNMPLELGLFLGAKRYSKLRSQKAKQCLIMDKAYHNYDKSISDLSGNDIVVHDMKVSSVIHEIRNWLAHFSKNLIPGGENIHKRYQAFQIDIPFICQKKCLNQTKLSYNDFLIITERWLKQS